MQDESISNPYESSFSNKSEEKVDDIEIRAEEERKVELVGSITNIEASRSRT